MISLSCRYDLRFRSVKSMSEGLFTQSESRSESEKDKRTSKEEQGINGKQQRKWPEHSLSRIVLL